MNLTVKKHWTIWPLDLYMYINLTHWLLSPLSDPAVVLFVFCYVVFVPFADKIQTWMCVCKMYPSICYWNVIDLLSMSACTQIYMDWYAVKCHDYIVSVSRDLWLLSVNWIIVFEFVSNVHIVQYCMWQFGKSLCLYEQLRQNVNLLLEWLL